MLSPKAAGNIVHIAEEGNYKIDVSMYCTVMSQRTHFCVFMLSRADLLIIWFM